MKIEREKKSRQAEVISSIMVKLEMAKNTYANVKKTFVMETFDIWTLSGNAYLLTFVKDK